MLMYLEDFPENYSATSRIYKEHGDFIYFVRPLRSEGEQRTKVRLVWNNEDKLWFAVVEGLYTCCLGGGFFTKGPFRLNGEAAENLCKYFKVPYPLRNSCRIADLVSMTSPGQFKKLSRLRRTSENKIH